MALIRYFHLLLLLAAVAAVVIHRGQRLYGVVKVVGLAAAGETVMRERLPLPAGLAILRQHLRHKVTTVGQIIPLRLIILAAVVVALAQLVAIILRQTVQGLAALVLLPASQGHQ